MGHPQTLPLAAVTGSPCKAGWFWDMGMSFCEGTLLGLFEREPLGNGSLSGFPYFERNPYYGSVFCLRTPFWTGDKTKYAGSKPFLVFLSLRLASKSVKLLSCVSLEAGAGVRGRLRRWRGRSRPDAGKWVEYVSK